MNRLFETKAGRAFRRGQSSFIDADTAKGTLSLDFGEDELLHLRWCTRDGSAASKEDTDLVVFPSDASLTKVSNDPAVRMYVLKFQSSDQLHFFWLQDPNADQDANDVARINELLNETNFHPPSTNEPPMEHTGISDNAHAPTAPAGPLNQDQLNSFVQELMRGMQQRATTDAVPDLALSDILTPSALVSVLQDPEVITSLSPFLPPDLVSPLSPVAGSDRQEMFRRIVASAPFRASVRSLDQALSTGLLGGLVTSLGMPTEAGLSVRSFLEAVQTQAAKHDQLEQEDSRNDE